MESVNDYSNQLSSTMSEIQKYPQRYKVLKAAVMEFIDIRNRRYGYKIKNIRPIKNYLYSPSFDDCHRRHIPLLKKLHGFTTKMDEDFPTYYDVKHSAIIAVKKFITDQRSVIKILEHLERKIAITKHSTTTPISEFDKIRLDIHDLIIKQNKFYNESLKLSRIERDNENMLISKLS